MFTQSKLLLRTQQNSVYTLLYFSESCALSFIHLFYSIFDICHLRPKTTSAFDTFLVVGGLWTYCRWKMVFLQKLDPNDSFTRSVKKRRHGKHQPPVNSTCGMWNISHITLVKPFTLKAKSYFQTVVY